MASGFCGPLGVGCVIFFVAVAHKTRATKKITQPTPTGPQNSDSAVVIMLIRLALNRISFLETATALPAINGYRCNSNQSKKDRFGFLALKRVRRLRLRKVPVEHERRAAKFGAGKPDFLAPIAHRAPEPNAPLAKTEHPEDRFKQEDIALTEMVNEASAKDRPIYDMPDPYTKEEAMCILCPRRYSVEIRPDFRNPKLLSQFISPHTGLVYKKHITGLCSFMQDEVEQEVNRAKALGG